MKCEMFKSLNTNEITKSDQRKKQKSGMITQFQWNLDIFLKERVLSNYISNVVIP